METPEIRLFHEQDLKACLVIFDSNIPQFFMPSERDEFIEWLAKPERDDYYVLIHNGAVVACGGIYHDDDNRETGLAWGMVRNDLHKQGFGSVLSLFRLDVISQKYPDYRQQLVTSQHTTAFYEKLGFEIVSVEKDGFGPGLDNCKMVRSSI